jgi:hypothetical protein
LNRTFSFATSRTHARRYGNDPRMKQSQAMLGQV